MAIDDRAARQTGGIEVEHRARGQWVVVSVSGELDIATVPVVWEALAAYAFPDGRRDAALDFSGLTFCDSSGLGLLVGIKKKLKAVDGRLILLHTPEFLARRLQQTGLDRSIPSHESLDSA